MGELAAKHLIAAGAKVIILNRDLQKAKDLCERLGVLSEYDSLENLKIFKSIRVFSQLLMHQMLLLQIL